MKKYPEILGRMIKLLPAEYRSAEWFDSLPLDIQNQFYSTVKNFPLQIAVDYLRTNHGCDGKDELNPIKKRHSKFGQVRGEMFSGNIFRFYFDDGAQNFRLDRDPRDWRFVGYVDIDGRRIVRTSRDSCYVGRKLDDTIKKALDGGALMATISKPKIFNLTLKIAEDIREGAA